MRRVWNGLVVVALVVGVAFAGAPPAGASTCTTVENRCYGIDLWFNAPQNIGVQMTTYITPNSYVADYVTYDGHINQSLWEGIANTTNMQYWIEVGWWRGWRNQDRLGWMWADNRPTYGYFDHWIATVTPPSSPNGPHTLNIVHGTTTNTWQIWIDGSVWGVSTQSPWYSRAMEAGVETTDNLNHINIAAAGGLYWKDTSSAWHAGWGGLIRQDSPCYAYWNVTGWDLYDGCN